MEITVWTILMGFVGLGLASAAYIGLGRIFPSGKERGSDAAFVVKLVSGIGIFALVCVATIPEFREYITGPAAAAPPGVPVDQITVGRTGYVLASVEDELTIPRTLIDNATIYVSTQQPVPRAAWTAVATDTTDASGSVVVTVRGLTSGMAYVTAYKSDYYSEFTTTVIPGPEVLPTTPALIRLKKVGGWEISITNESANITFDGENLVENSTTATSGYFTLNIAPDTAFTALKNIRWLEIKGDDFATLGATIVPTILNNGGTLPSITGDTTLSTAAVANIDFSGDLLYGQVIQVKVTVSVSAASTGTIARISLDDLLGSTGYLNETGAAETVLYIKAVE